MPLFFPFGSTWLALRLVPIVLSAVAALLVWRVGLRLGGKRTAAVAAAVTWIWPPLSVYQLTHQQGFYALGLAFSGRRRRSCRSRPGWSRGPW